MGSPTLPLKAALRLAISRGIVTGIAEPDDQIASGPQAAQLLLKAVRGLPEHEQDVVLALLVERALGGQAEGLPPEFGGATEHPDVPARRLGPQPWPSPPIPAGVLQGLGSVAGGMLLGDSGVADVAALCAITEDQVRDVLRDVSSGPGGPQQLKDYLGLLGEGRACAQARRKLKLTRNELEALREAPAATKLELRLARLLLAKSQQGDTLRALVGHMPAGFGPPGTPPAGMAAAHDIIRRLVLDGQGVEQIARACGVRVDVARSALEEAAAHPDASEPLASILRLIAAGRSRAQAASEVGVSEEELAAALDPLSSSPLQKKLAQAFSAGAVGRPLVGAPGSSERTVMVGSGALGPGAQQVVPVRFPEAQHQRLKDWCTTHGFSMAVVLRGLVERFLDNQERRAA